MQPHVGEGLPEVEILEETHRADAAVRGEHLANVARLREEGVIIEAGAYSDKMTSSVLLVRADDAAAALALARRDVYVKAGVWGDIAARPFGRVVSTDPIS